jgi:hypothetical protein
MAFARLDGDRLAGGEPLVAVVDPERGRPSLDREPFGAVLVVCSGGPSNPGV